jgi:predicted component of type VI protein secretion system
VSTVRFSKVIEACGKPDIHLLLIDPAEDKTLQAAIKTDRVMTLYQQSGGTDHAVVGFEQGRSRQFLVFPKPLKPFLGQRIVGIKYELLDEIPAPKKETPKKEVAKKPDEHPSKPASTGKDREPPKQAEVQTPTVVPKPSAPKPDETASDAEKKLDQESGKAVSEDKVVKFQKTEPERQPAPESDEIKEIKRHVREAMEALEQGKQIVAFNLLKRILDLD